LKELTNLLNQQELSRSDLVFLLSLTEKGDRDKLLAKALEVRKVQVGLNVYLRGLIEFSNHCRKDCLYCGIRNGNRRVERYTLSDEEVLKTVLQARKIGLNSVVLQAGEESASLYLRRITALLRQIRQTTDPGFRITLSLGEQSEDTYREWFEAGASRYLLRIETSNETLYRKIHPDNDLHRFETRLKCLEFLREIGYQTGTGVMIGLPFQTFDDLADDLLFMKNRDIDMVGMGPYVEHSATPLYREAASLKPLLDRFHLSLRMIEVLRLLLPTINIVASTALQALHPFGRELGLKAGANVLMPNLTPLRYRENYLLYENKPCLEEGSVEGLTALAERISAAGLSVQLDDYGDSSHFLQRKNPSKSTTYDYQRGGL
jgi:biotin synthase